MSVPFGGVHDSLYLFFWFSLFDHFFIHPWFYFFPFSFIVSFFLFPTHQYAFSSLSFFLFRLPPPFFLLDIPVFLVTSFRLLFSFHFSLVLPFSCFYLHLSSTPACFPFATLPFPVSRVPVFFAALTSTSCYHSCSPLPVAFFFCFWRRQKIFTLLDLCVSSLRRGHANLVCIVPILSDDLFRESIEEVPRQWPSLRPDLFPGPHRARKCNTSACAILRTLSRPGNCYNSVFVCLRLQH